ncbi:PepSY domain-containing protein [Marinobacterium sp. YM272]|uniref:PepSY domain-containing protein n=1 Tax=Marinobacterium sp. YM272 TaxID=3421654 RepID=UPI003D7F8273
MKKFLALSAIAFGAVSGTAFAEDLCNVPEEQWQSMDAFEQAITDKGWKIKKTKVDDGCYEVYGWNEEGEKVEAYFNPKTFELVKMDD